MRFEVLGPIRVKAGSFEITITARREQILLATLLLNLGQHVEHGYLVDAMWANSPPASAATQVHGVVYRLRKRLAAAGVPEHFIVTESASYRARVDPHRVDMWEFRRLRGEARAAASRGEAGEARLSYRAALGLWYGTAFAGVDSLPLRQAAAALDEERVRTLEECIEVELRLGGAGELVPELTGLVQQYPYRENLHGARMLALYRAGRHAEALAAYRHARQVLHDELGTEPGTELQRLHQAMLNHDPVLAGSRPEPANLPGIGDLVPRQLPADVAGFVGRAEALRTLGELPRRSALAPVPIYLIVGTPGVGKTALAVHWAQHIRDQFPDGQLFVNLNGYATSPPRRPIEALAGFLRAFAVPGERVPVDMDEAAAMYRSLLADRRVLVVLDNAASVDQIRPLLPGTPGCLVIVTSREQLDGLVAHDGAFRLGLDVLSADEAKALLSNMLGAERSAAEPDGLTELAELCGRLPLALQIAAAKLTASPRRRIADYVGQLRDQDRLAALSVAGDPRHAVAPAFDLSYTRLPEPARHCFRLLGLAPGPDVTAESVAAMAGTTTRQAAQMLELLACAHLVEEHIPGRYTCHDLLRHYAAVCAEREESGAVRDAALRRLLDWYLDATEVAATAVRPQRLPLVGRAADPVTCSTRPRPPVRPSDPAQARLWLEAEWTNLVAAAAYAAEHGLRQQGRMLSARLRDDSW